MAKSIMNTEAKDKKPRTKMDYFWRCIASVGLVLVCLGAPFLAGYDSGRDNSPQWHNKPPAQPPLPGQSLIIKYKGVYYKAVEVEERTEWIPTESQSDGKNK